MPLGDGITFSYGSGIDTYNFDPRPLFTVNKEMIKTPSNIGLATKYNMTLNGYVLPTGGDQGSAGLSNVISGTNVLRDSFARDFKLLLLQCGSDAPLISGYPKVISIDVNNASDNYVQRADYTINLELPSLTGGTSDLAGEFCDGSISGDLSASGLISLTDDFTVEFLDQKVGGDINIAGFGSSPSVFSLQRTLSAQGDPTACVASSYEPWEIAKNYVSANLGLTPAMTGLVGLMCVSGMSIASNFRNISVNKTDGSVNATETFVAYTGSNPATEEMEVSSERSSDSPHISVTVNGTIQGLNTIDYGAGGCVPTGETTFNNALTAWNGVSGALYARANGAYTTLIPNNRPIGMQTALNIVPLSESIGYNPIVGTVTYSNNYDDRPDNINSYALMESINYTDTYANDVFASITVLGRTSGPLLQSIGTVGPTVAEISIDSIMFPVQGDVSGITADQYLAYSGLIENYENGLLARADVSRIFINNFNETWDPKGGHYTLNKSWTLGKCS